MIWGVGTFLVSLYCENQTEYTCLCLMGLRRTRWSLVQRKLGRKQLIESSAREESAVLRVYSSRMVGHDSSKIKIHVGRK